MEPCRNPIRHLSNRQVVLLFPVVAAVVPPTGLDMEWIVSLITNNRARQIEQSYRQVTGDLALHFPVVPWWSVWLGYLLLAIRSHATINTTAMHIDHPVELLCYTQPCSLFFWWLSENTVGVVVENADLLSDTIPYVLGICTDSCQVELWWMQEIHDLQRGLSLMRDHPLFERTVVALAPHLFDSLLVRSDVLPVLIWDSSN
jgi:hypothetical protein